MELIRNNSAMHWLGLHFVELVCKLSRAGLLALFPRLSLTKGFTEPSTTSETQEHNWVLERKMLFFLLASWMVQTSDDMRVVIFFIIPLNFLQSLVNVCPMPIILNQPNNQPNTSTNMLDSRIHIPINTSYCLSCIYSELRLNLISRTIPQPRYLQEKNESKPCLLFIWVSKYRSAFAVRNLEFVFNSLRVWMNFSLKVKQISFVA